MAAAAAAAPAPLQVELTTTLGPIVLELYTAHAPRTCANFAGLARRGYYDGCPVHRIVAGFVIQSGDPTGTGRGGESIYNGGGAFEDELHPDLHHTGAGVLSMANAGPHTNRSQFFITLAPAPHLDRKHAVFGRVAAGMGVVEKLSRVAVGADDRPLAPLRIEAARVLGE